MKTTADLLALASDALAGTALPPDEFLNKVAAYAESFEIWKLSHSQELSGSIPAANLPEFQSLAEAHAKIVDRVEELKSKTEFDLKHIKRKGKGIMAYTDTLPKRISISTKRRG